MLPFVIYRVLLGLAIFALLSLIDESRRRGRGRNFAC